MNADVIIIGAGLSGATAARELTSAGLSVIVLEKARGPGGRMSTRRSGSSVFDHGAQYFTARDAAFVQQVERWQQSGVVAEWQARIGVIDEHRAAPSTASVQRFVGVPGMNAVCKELLATDIDCRYGVEVASAQREQAQWRVLTRDGVQLSANALVCSVPPHQAREILVHPPAREVLAGVQMKPCWAVMLQLARPLLADRDAAFVNSGPLSWISSQNSRPQRPAAQCWVLHASPAWSAANLEKPATHVTDTLVSAAFKLPGANESAVLYSAAHRWRYSIAEEPLHQGAVNFKTDCLVLAGDWCSGSRVEGAWLSGCAASRYTLGQ